MRLKLAQTFGWTYAQIDGMSQRDVAVTLQILEGIAMRDKVRGT